MSENVKLTAPQRAAQKAMLKADGWARKGEGINKQAVTGLVEAGLANWGNVHASWTARLVECGPPKFEPLVRTGQTIEGMAAATDVARSTHPDAHSFAPAVDVNGVMCGFTYATTDGPDPEFSFVTATGTVSAAPYPNRGEAAFWCGAYNAEDKREARR